MKKYLTKEYLDLIPLAILYLCGINLGTKLFFTEIILVWQHYLAMVLLIICPFLIIKNHQIGVLSIGFLIFAGYWGYLSFSPELYTVSYTFGTEDYQIYLFRGQPIFIVLCIIHLIFSHRFYFGILTKKYWRTLF
jgi:hypothetical protein